MARDPETIMLPVQSHYFEWCMANSSALQAAMMNYTGQISYHLPSHPVIKLGSQVRFGQKQLNQSSPVNGPTVFTDGSGRTGKAAIVWKDGPQWQHQVEYQDGSPQVVELRAMTMAFQAFPGPVNIVTDSAYVAGLVQRLDKAVLGHVSNEKLFGILKLLWFEIQKRHHEYYVMHVKSHTTLPGFIIEGNAKADSLVSAVTLGPVPDVKQQAIASHNFYHQGYRALRRQFGISNSEARAIVAACPDCQGQHIPTYY
ncbi:POK19 protein, partial [Baryphthengus martii]|nr:POK19 protein [Baryphthengus martii]